MSSEAPPPLLSFGARRCPCSWLVCVCVCGKCIKLTARYAVDFSQISNVIVKACTAVRCSRRRCAGRKEEEREREREECEEIGGRKTVSLYDGSRCLGRHAIK